MSYSLSPEPPIFSDIHLVMAPKMTSRWSVSQFLDFCSLYINISSAAITEKCDTLQDLRCNLKGLHQLLPRCKISLSFVGIISLLMYIFHKGLLLVRPPLRINLFIHNKSVNECIQCILKHVHQVVSHQMVTENRAIKTSNVVTNAQGLLF